jgi:hypothetical protein
LNQSLNLFKLSFLFGLFHSFQNVPLLFKQVGHGVDSLFGVSQGIYFLSSFNDQLISELNSLPILLLNLVLFLVRFHLVFFYPNVVVELHICEFLGFKVLDDVVSMIR